MISAPGHTQGVGPSVPSLSTKEIKPPNNWNKNETHEKLAKLLWLRSCGDTGLKCRLLRKLWQDDLQVQGLPGLHPTRTPAGLKVSKTDSFCTSFLCVQGNNLIHNSNRNKNKQKRPSYLESNMFINHMLKFSCSLVAWINGETLSYSWLRKPWTPNRLLKEFGKRFEELT